MIFDMHVDVCMCIYVSVVDIVVATQSCDRNYTCDDGVLVDCSGRVVPGQGVLEAHGCSEAF